MDLQRILSDAGVSAVRSLINVLTGIILIPIIIRLLGADAYGTWTIILAFISLVVIIGELHLHGALIRYSSKENDSQVFIDTLTLTVLIGVLLATCIIIGGYFVIKTILVDKLSFTIIVPIGFLIAMRIPGQILRNYLRAHQNVKGFEALEIIKSLAEMGAVIGILWQTSSLVGAIWAFVVVMFVFNLVLSVIFLPKHLTWPQPSNFTYYLRYSLPMVPKDLSGRILHDADKFLILFFLGPTATGIYAVAYSASSIFTSVTTVFNSTLYPNVTHAWDNGEFDQLRRFYTTILRWYWILALPAIAGLALLAVPILRLLSTASIAHQGVVLVPVLAIGFALQGLEFPLSYPLTAVEQTRTIAIITIVAVVINLLLNIALIPVVGVIGAAIATAVAFATRTVLLFMAVTNHLPIPLPIVGPVKSSIATVVMTIFLIVLPIEGWKRTLIIYPTIGVVVFSVVFILIGGFLPKEKHVIRKTIWTYCPMRFNNYFKE